jgi:hypothetical protein
MQKPSPQHGSGGFREKGAKFFGGIAGRYRDLKRRLADMLMRGDRDYAMLSALSQEVGRTSASGDVPRRRHLRTFAAAGGRARDP